MKAQKIMLIRHAEKPASPTHTHGVNRDGSKDDESLSVVGWQRAGALAAVMGNAPQMAAGLSLLRPQYLFATGMKTSDDSKRPIQTLSPLADKLGLIISMHYGKGAEAELAASAVACNGVVLICWEHHLIPAIADALLGEPGISPPTWPGDRYDLTWVFDLDETGAYLFSQMPQQLLAGDRTTVAAG
ncbi:MAG: histidine phosphatase family protein [Pseudomonadota bacterium]